MSSCHRQWERTTALQWYHGCHYRASRETTGCQPESMLICQLMRLLGLATERDAGGPAVAGHE